MRNLIKKAIFFLCAALLLTSLTACFYGSGDDDDTEWKEEAYKKLTDAPPPAIHASKEPFSLGELIPPTKDSPIWEIQYGDFPVMMCSNLFTDLGNGFARAFLNFEGRDNAEPFVSDSKKAMCWIVF